MTLPAAAHAAVVINEIMYNPAGADSGREWVELYNNGPEDVTLVGGQGSGSWRIADSSNHTITDPAGGVGRGSLTISAGGYLLFASDPSAVMGEYGGDYAIAKASITLSNTGTTVALIDGAGKTIDSVAYSASLGGGDNGTSLQLASSTWLQALPTPGKANATERYDPPQEAGGSSNKSDATSNPGYVTPPLPQVFADAGGDRTVIVGADTTFVATAYDRDRDIINYAKFYWNFGDGTSKEGPEVMHHFSYPGRYAVELTVTNTKIKTTSRVTVTAKPASVVLAPLADGGVAIQNHADRDLDLSFWQVGAGGRTFTLPEHSVALKDAAINIAAKTLGFQAQGAKLYYPDGNPVAEDADILKFENVDGLKLDAPAKKLVAAESRESKPEAPQTPKSKPQPQNNTSLIESLPQSQTQAELAAAAATSDTSLPLWASLAGLAGLVSVGVASVWAIRKRAVTTDPAEEFTIE